MGRELLPFRFTRHLTAIEDAPMQVIHVHWEGSAYHVVRVAKEHPPELVFCESPEELTVVLRGLGVAQPGVNYVLRQLEVGPDAMVSGERE